MSETKYEPVRAKGYYSLEDEQGETFYIVPSDVAGFAVKKETQLDRIEQKMDRILEVSESGKLSTSFELDFKNSAKVINDQLDQMLEVRKRNARNLR